MTEIHIPRRAYSGTPFVEAIQETTEGEHSRIVARPDDHPLTAVEQADAMFYALHHNPHVWNGESRPRKVKKLGV